MPTCITRLVAETIGYSAGGAAHDGQRRRGRGEALLDELAGLEHVGAVLEVQEDRRELRHRLRLDLGHPGHALERVLERDGDERFDLRRRQAETLGLDLDRDRRELREHVDLLMAERLHAEEHQRDRARDHEVAEAQAQVDDRAASTQPPAAASVTGARLTSAPAPRSGRRTAPPRRRITTFVAGVRSRCSDTRSCRRSDRR